MKRKDKSELQRLVEQLVELETMAQRLKSLKRHRSRHLKHQIKKISHED